MTSGDSKGNEGADDRGAALRARREEQRRRQVRRRRLIAGLVLALGGGDSSKQPTADVSGPATVVDAGGPGASGNAVGGDAKAEGKVRNATPQPSWKPYTGPVPILEYHVLGEAPADAPYPELYVTRPDFHQQMDWLDQHGYQAVALEQVQDAWYHGGTLPPKPVVISFDDGYRPQFTYALPELRKHGWAGVLNLKAEGSDLYESNVKAMIAAGWELASHTINHSDLTTLDAAALKEEVSGSREQLQREYSVPVKNFCYPAGQFDATVIA